MGRQSRSRKTENIGKGKVTPVQIAFIVDRYLSDNCFSETRTTFRSEASHLLAKSPVNEVAIDWRFVGLFKLGFFQFVYLDVLTNLEWFSMMYD